MKDILHKNNVPTATYIHTYIHTYTYMHAGLYEGHPTQEQCSYCNIHTYIYIHTYIHTYTYTQAFMKDILRKNNVPTATYIRTKDPEEAKAYIRKNSEYICACMYVYNQEK